MIPASVITDLFGVPVLAEPKVKVHGYACPPGTGPNGETCKTCAHCVRSGTGTRRYPKCLVIQHRWTHGPGTDIKVNSPACELWKACP